MCSIPKMDFKFLWKYDQLKGWGKSLENYTVTTRCICIGNDIAFLKAAELPEVTETRKTINSGIFRLEIMMKGRRSAHENLS